MMIVPIDVRYLGVEGAANAFLVRGPAGDALVECGPAACLDTLLQGLAAHGVASHCIPDLLLSHIHLDHGGAAGHLAATGTRVLAHPFGIPHLVDPAKLTASSRRVHGAAYDRFYGDPIPVPESLALPVDDGAGPVVAGLRWRALHTPGHARHHVVWTLERAEELHAFMGDLAGILVPGSRFIAVPTPPPEFDPDAWIASLRRVADEEPSHLWLTHGGCAAATRADARRLLEHAADRVRATSEWLRSAVHLPADDAVAEGLVRERGLAQAGGVDGRRMDDFIDAAFVRMNLGGARRAFLPRD